jgi:hypothetical protein
MNLEAYSNMFIKLYVDDGCGYAGVGIPLKQLLPNKQNGSSYDTLRYFALAALFKYEGGNVPAYALKNFGTQFTCKYDGKHVVMKNNKELSDILEAACTDSLMDDNEGIVLDIHCNFFNDFMCEEVKKIRQSATYAAENVIKTMKAWIEKTSKMLNNSKSFENEEEFVVVGKDGKECEQVDKDANPVDWAMRFVHILLMPETQSGQKVKKALMNQKALRNQKAEVIFDRIEDAFDHLTFALVGGFAILSDIFDETVSRHEDAVREFTVERSSDKDLSHSPVSNNSISELADEEAEKDASFNCEEKISFNCEDKNAPEEWKIFFESSPTEDEEEEDAVFIESPTDDVISLSSEDASIANSDKGVSLHEAEIDDDDDDDSSWTMLDDDM